MAYDKEWFSGRAVDDDWNDCPRRFMCRLARVTVWVLALWALAALFATQGWAAGLEVKAPVWETHVISSGEGALSISDQPCTQPVAMERWERLRAFNAYFGYDIGEVRQSRLLWHGKVYAGCYAVDSDGVHNIDSTGERLTPAIPRDKFVPHEGALPAGGKSV